MDEETWTALITCANAAQNSDNDRIIRAGLLAEEWLTKPENAWED